MMRTTLETDDTGSETVAITTDCLYLKINNKQKEKPEA